ncbi:unnamed protein product [Caenorhabditis auriculariae]|uniref:Uncharacterized protein n=1 Tax=Caenorhabditis auriculariae TaxID=2777116 RepID=A0A8S1GYY3_9PELO|nr:unnamed protein product [Caenorhabditis auriculariae]
MLQSVSAHLMDERRGSRDDRRASARHRRMTQPHTAEPGASPPTGGYDTRFLTPALWHGTRFIEDFQPSMVTPTENPIGWAVFNPLPIRPPAPRPRIRQFVPPPGAPDANCLNERPSFKHLDPPSSRDFDEDVENLMRPDIPVLLLTIEGIVRVKISIAASGAQLPTVWRAMFLRKFWNQWTLEENARRMTITVLPSGTKKVHLKDLNELAELHPEKADQKREHDDSAHSAAPWRQTMFFGVDK